MTARCRRAGNRRGDMSCIESAAGIDKIATINALSSTSFFAVATNTEATV